MSLPVHAEGLVNIYMSVIKTTSSLTSQFSLIDVIFPFLFASYSHWLKDDHYLILISLLLSRLEPSLQIAHVIKRIYPTSHPARFDIMSFSCAGPRTNPHSYLIVTKIHDPLDILHFGARQESIDKPSLYKQAFPRRKVLCELVMNSTTPSQRKRLMASGKISIWLSTQ